MNEFIIIYNAPNFESKQTAVDEFLRDRNFNFRRLSQEWPHIVHVDSELSTEQFAKELRSNPSNGGAILFSINQTVHV